MADVSVRAPGAELERPAAAREHLGGLLAGLLGGAAMLALVVAAAVEGPGVATALRPLGGEGGALAFGLVVLAVSAALVGWLFAWLLPHDFPVAAACLVGAGFGLVVMAFVSAIVLPAVAPAVRSEMSPLGGSWVAGYAVFGAILGLGPALARGLRSRRLRAGRRRGVGASGGREELPA